MCFWILNRIWETCQKVSVGVRKCLSLFWFVFWLEKNPVRLFEPPLVQLTTIESRFNSFTLTNSAGNVFCLDHFELSATTKRQQTLWRIKLVKCECQTTKEVCVYDRYTPDKISEFAKPVRQSLMDSVHKRRLGQKETRLIISKNILIIPHHCRSRKHISNQKTWLAKLSKSNEEIHSISNFQTQQKEIQSERRPNLMRNIKIPRNFTSI